MKKIISLFQRDYDGNRQVYNQLVPGAEWVLAGEGVPTRKWDGTCVLIENGVMWKRYEVKKGKTPPPEFRPANDVDPNTGKQQGWLPVNAADPADRWHIEALWNDDAVPSDYADGTYELIGPKVQGNPEGVSRHLLMRHDTSVLQVKVPTEFVALRDFLDGGGMEGIVWHHPDGRMVKIKARDFGIRR